MDTVGKNAKRIEEYIRKQLEEDKLGDQLTIRELALLKAASNNPMRMADRITRLRVRTMPACERPPTLPVDVYSQLYRVD